MPCSGSRPRKSSAKLRNLSDIHVAELDCDGLRLPNLTFDIRTWAVRHKYRTSSVLETDGAYRNLSDKSARVVSVGVLGVEFYPLREQQGTTASTKIHL